MAYDISELKKLPTEEKLQIIDELRETIDNSKTTEEATFDEEPEVVAMLQERIEKYERGEGDSYSWQEAKKILLANMDKRQNGK